MIKPSRSIGSGRARCVIILCYQLRFLRAFPGQQGRFRASKGHRPARANRPDIHIPCSLVAAFAHRRVIDPRAQSRRGHSRAMSPQWGVCRRKKWQVNVRRKTELPPGPPLAPMRHERRLHMFGGSGCRGFLETSAFAEEILCKVAARVPWQVSMQPR